MRNKYREIIQEYLKTADLAPSSNREEYLERLLDSLEKEFRSLLECMHNLSAWVHTPLHTNLLAKIEKFTHIGLRLTVIDSHLLKDKVNLKDAIKIVKDLIGEIHGDLLHVETHQKLDDSQFEEVRKCSHLLDNIKQTLRQIAHHL